jgi:uncharacterized protein
MKSGIIYIDENVFSSLLAVSFEEQAQGLMYQKWPPPNMAFLYNRPKVNKFWMKNTPSPLDIIFSHKGKVNQICRGEPFSTSAIGGEELSDLIIELPYGSVNKFGIKLGSSIGLIKLL